MMERQLRKLHFHPELHIPGITPRGGRIVSLHKRYPPGAERTRRVVRELEKDIALLNAQGPAVPPAVAQAREAFAAAVAGAQKAIDELGEVGVLALEARDADVQAAAAAIREGRPQPKELAVTRARQAEEAALVKLDGAERVVMDAHFELTEAARICWPEWRRSLVGTVLKLHPECQKALERLSGLLEGHYAALSGIVSLDRGITGRYKELRQAVAEERRCGLAIFDAVTNMSAGSPLPVDALQVLEEHLGGETSGLTEWAPPGDPAHDELLQKPLDMSAEWVRNAILPKNMICPECGRKLPHDVEIDSKTLKPIHECKPLMVSFRL